MFLIDSTYYQIRETPHKGRGAFAKLDIDPGVLIGDYIGRVLKTSEAIKTEHQGTYYMEVSDRYSILAEKTTAGIHLINHSCTPNCGTIDYKGRALYASIRKIHKGEELTVNYNFGPPDEETCNPCRHSCHCGSQFCTGTMHTAGDKDTLINSEYSNHSDAFKKKMRQLEGKMLPPLTSYPKTLSDDSFFDLYGYEKLMPITLQNSRIPTIKELRKFIRDPGRTLAFPKLGLVVHGVMNLAFVSTLLKK